MHVYLPRLSHPAVCHHILSSSTVCYLHYPFPLTRLSIGSLIVVLLSSFALVCIANFLLLHLIPYVRLKYNDSCLSLSLPTRDTHLSTSFLRRDA